MVRHTGGRRIKVTGKLHLKLHNRKEIGFLPPISSQQIYHVDFAKQMRSTPTHQVKCFIFFIFLNFHPPTTMYQQTFSHPPLCLSV